MLIEAGGRANEADRQGCTPLHIAARQGDTKAATLLLEHGADIEAIEMVCLSLICTFTCTVNTFFARCVQVFRQFVAIS